MLTISVTDRAGDERSTKVDLSGKPTLMEAIRNDGTFDMVAMCGGLLSCSTCHVYVETEWEQRIEPISDEEQELVSSSSFYQSNSRLSCQIHLTQALDGLAVTIAPED